MGHAVGSFSTIAWTGLGLSNVVAYKPQPFLRSLRDLAGRSKGEEAQGQRTCAPAYQGVEDHHKEVALWRGYQYLGQIRDEVQLDFLAFSPHKMSSHSFVCK